jgi:hypothetical protein
VSRVLKHFGTKGKPEKGQNATSLERRRRMNRIGREGRLVPVSAGLTGTIFDRAEIGDHLSSGGVREAAGKSFRFGKFPGTTRSPRLSIA